MIELGGGIFLENFEELEPGKLIVVKKVVGNYTKTISEKAKDFKKITVSLSKPDDYKIEIKLETAIDLETDAEDKNLFFALDKALSDIVDKIDQ